MSYFNVLIPALSMCFNILAQVFLCKYIIKKGLLKTIYLGFLCGLVIFIVCEFIAYRQPFEDWLALFLANLIIYGCFSSSFFTFINMGETARRIRLLRELYETPAGLTKAQILSRYNAEEMINIRMGRLLNNNQVILRDQRYYVASPVMLLISKVIILMKLVILGKESEFDRHDK